MIEYAKEIITILSSIIIALIGGGGLLYYSVNKKLKNIQADREASTEWKKLFDEKVEECKVLVVKNTDLYQHRMTLFEDNNSLRVQLAEKDVEIARKEIEIAHKEIEITKLKYDRCYIVGCKKRVPKRNEISDIKD